MTDKRVVILEDGQVTIGGVEYVLVKKEIVETLLKADDSYPIILATPDLSGLPAPSKETETWSPKKQTLLTR